MRYSKEVKEKVCALAKSGIHLKIIQHEHGPNPKAIIRYLKSMYDIDYKEMRKGFKDKPKTLIKLNEDKNGKRK